MKLSLFKKTDMKTDVLLCKCYSPEHQILIMEDDGDVFIVIHLCSLPIWKRIKRAIKYIFGYKCRYGAYDEIILDPKDWKKIQKVADCLKKGLTED